MFPNYYGFPLNYYCQNFSNSQFQPANISYPNLYDSCFYYSAFSDKKVEEQKIYKQQQPVNIFESTEPKATQNFAAIQQFKGKQKKRRGLDKFKQMESAKKNSQSNITNQYFSFYSNRLLSYKNLMKSIRKLNKTSHQQEKIASIFYNIMHCISSQRGKKYVNRKTMSNFFFADSILQQIPLLDEQINKLGFITLEEICAIIRQCCYNYLRFDCILNVISSKRISQASKGEHLKRRRAIIKNMMELMGQVNAGNNQ